MMLLTILLYKKGWVKPVKPTESESRPPIFWISITVVVMLGIISLIRWMGW